VVIERDRFPVVVHVLLLRGDRLFLLRRANTGFMDGYFALPGGHQHAGENVRSAAARECLEETGAHPASLRPVCVLPYRSGGHQGVNFVFEADGWSAEPAIAEPGSFDAAGWYPVDALPTPHAGWIPLALGLRGDGRWFEELHWD
jgi:8-oxo-dGTP pyrophosphatase MutT (NUDIX family)